MAKNCQNAGQIDNVYYVVRNTVIEEGDEGTTGRRAGTKKKIEDNRNSCWKSAREKHFKQCYLA